MTVTIGRPTAQEPAFLLVPGPGGDPTRRGSPRRNQASLSRSLTLQAGGSLPGVPRSRGRKPARRPARHPRRRGPGPAAEDAGARLTGLLEYGDPADPVQVTALLPLFLDAVAADHRLPAERCLDDCVVLAHAYAQLGIAAEVRAAELVITSAATGHSSTHGSLNPRWTDGL